MNLNDQSKRYLKKTEDDPMEQEHYGGKNDEKGPNNPIPQGHYMLNPCCMLFRANIMA